MQFLTFSISSQVMHGTYGLLLAIGVVIGLFGSAIAMGRYLKV